MVERALEDGKKKVCFKYLSDIKLMTTDKTFVCPKGNPGMASAGMGDVLSGIIAGLCAQGLSLSDAATLGVWVHAAAGDQIARTRGEIGLLASDLINALPGILNGAQL